MIKKHTISFLHAYEGLIWAFQTQPNYKIHFFLSFLSIIGGYFLKIDYYEFLIILFLIAVGLAIETINTSIEQASDAIDKKWRQDIKIVKNVAAGAMLIFAIGALIIACVIFIPKILSLLFY